MSTQLAVLDPQSSSLRVGPPHAGSIAFADVFDDSTDAAWRPDTIVPSARFGLVGDSPAMRRVLDRVGRVAATGATVLVSGETGTGKELIARAIHAASPRAKRPFVTLNCGALAEGLVASELFGHERGAFTGALERRKGRFELANGGTIFLDEVGELPPAMQVALLRVLQEGEFERVGGVETLKTDARVVAATNRDLTEAVRQERFRADLLFRLNVFPIEVPPLRERKGDIIAIAGHYADQFARKVRKRIRGVSPNALRALLDYPWPGNVRELQNILERAVILARGEMLELTDFELPESFAPQKVAPVDARQAIEEALRKARGRVGGLDGAAASLGVAPSTLESRIQRLGIDKFAFRPGRRD
jgi:formate hydrogenlyase transcriptional activator